MKPARFLSLAIFIFIFAFSTFSYAGVPQMINYQGKLTDTSGVLICEDGGPAYLKMEFTIYSNSINDDSLWKEVHDSVRVEFGVFSVLLGSINPIPDSVFNGDVRYLGVKVEDDFEMSPRKAIVSVGYAFKSEYTDTAEYAKVAVSDGDWIIIGDDMYSAVSGNVGIGTNDPIGKLDVLIEDLGTARVTGINSQAGADSSSIAIIGSAWPTSSDGEAIGVKGFGFSNIYGSSKIYGGYFSGWALYGAYNAYGVYAASYGIYADTTYGVYAIAKDADVNYGLYAKVPAGNSGFAGYFDGEKNYFSGNVGIGTINPETKLHLYSSSGTDQFVVGGSESEGRAVIGYDHANNRLKLVTYKSGYGNVTIPEGNLGIGTISPQGALDVNSTTGALIVPRMSTAQRNALSAVNGMIIYNTTTNQFNFYENGAWVTK